MIILSVHVFVVLAWKSKVIESVLTHGIRLSRPVETGGTGGLQPPPQIFPNFYFWSIEKIMLKWKVVQNYKTSLDSSKFIDIYNIIIVLDTREDILSVMNPESFSYF